MKTTTELRNGTVTITIPLKGNLVSSVTIYEVHNETDGQTDLCLSVSSMNLETPTQVSAFIEVLNRVETAMLLRGRSILEIFYFLKAIEKEQEKTA